MVTKSTFARGLSGKAQLLASLGSGFALISLAASAHAQSAPAPAESEQQAEEGARSEILVTGTRITNSTFSAPTPTTVVSIEQLQQTAQPNIYDSIAQLPSLAGSVGTANSRNNGGTSFGNNGLSSLNLRGLGANRTLVLIDGQRVVASHVTGLTDVSQFPQLLIKRVDVVTGGASASWGSDAVAGVVNFVTDTRFTGIKANVQGGVSTYGDDKSVLVQVAGGFKAMDDRLHFQASGEFYDNKGVPGGDIGGAQPNGRPDAWRSGTTSYGLATTPAGSPQYYNWPYNAQNITLGRYGLITAGPAALKGLAFDASGKAYAFAYGSPCVATTCLGGQQDNYVTTSTIDNPINRKVGYGRLGFEVVPDVELYGTLTVAQVKTENSPLAFPRKPGNLTIKCSNAYLANVTLPGSTTTIPQACAAANVTTFTLGSINANFPLRETIKTDRRQVRWVAGVTGKFSVAGMPISFDGYYQRGKTDADVRLSNMTLNGHYNAAIDATVLNGQIVCASATARAAGCIPVNIFGGAPVTVDQFRWMAPANGPFQLNTFKEDAASLSFNFSPFKTWAGEVSVAFGGEWRKESYVTHADPYGNGVTADTPNTAEYPADATLLTAGSNWFAGNFKNGSGQFSVKEAFVELGIPLADGSAGIGKIDLNLGGRAAHYSTAGDATTWKAGASWETPLDGLRLRGVISRDIRAPNLNDLFAPVTAASQNVINRATGGNVQVLATTIGNANLKPEVGKTWELGAIYRPAFIPGLNLSVDYFDIKLDKAIASLGIQQIVDLCYNGNTAYCANVKLTGAFGTADPTYVIQQPFNLASLKARGFDIEVGYQFELGNMGKVTLRGLATRAIDMISNTGIAGQQIAQLAGNNSEGGSGLPRWKGLLSQQWSNDKATVTITERLVSAGKIDPYAIVCTSGCPATTVQNPTYDFNDIPGAVYVDIGGSYDVLDNAEVYFKVDNVFNHRAPPFGGSTLYDVVGRMFRVGARIKM